MRFRPSSPVKAGKDIYVEKPLATTIDEGRAMLKPPARTAAIVQMGTHWRRGRPLQRGRRTRPQSGKTRRRRSGRAGRYLDWLGRYRQSAQSQPPASRLRHVARPGPERPSTQPLPLQLSLVLGLRRRTDDRLGRSPDRRHALEWPEESHHRQIHRRQIRTDDNSETPDTQIALYEFPSYTLMWEHKVGTGLGLNGRPWGMSWVGSEGTLILNDVGYEIISEPKKKSLEHVEVKGSGDPRGAHVRNFLDCMKSRAQPSTNLDIGHHVSTIAHLGNIALRSNSRVVWTPKTSASSTTKKRTSSSQWNIASRGNYRI